ncbi:MAG: hypothetical protein WD048_06320 [Chitinophagales bacterium]
MKLVEVTNDQQSKEFLDVSEKIYKDDPNWIRPLDNDINQIFNPKKNKFFKHGSLSRWLLKNDQGENIGRVAAFINESNANKFDQPTGGMGFFECINDREAAFMLFDKCKEWLEEHGMEAMDGPVNFGERHQWWGLLIEGFTEPCYGMNYHAEYYKSLFEAYGFQIYFKQYSYGMKVNAPRPKIYYERAKKVLEDPNYSFKHADLNDLEKYTEDFRHVYNNAFGGREGVKPMTKKQAKNLINTLKPVLVDYLLWLGYYKDDPIAMFFMMPELNQYFKHVNGKMNWLGKLKFVWHRWRKTNRKMYGFLFGVVPEHQRKGVEGGIIIAANEVVVPKKRWDDLELIWIGDFNPKMMRIAEHLGAEIVKTHATFRKLFDPNKPFKRKPIED